MFKIFRLFAKVLSEYTYLDKIFTALSVVVLLLMVMKLMLFPYGVFGFGDTEIYTEGIISEKGIQNINPLFVDYNDADREVSALVFSGLMKYDSSKKAVVSDMADLVIDEDKLIYTFTMREGLKWQDGESLTAEDVYFTFHDLILNESFQNDILKTNFDGVEVELIDDMTISFTLENPNVFFVNNLTVGVLPKHILGKVPVSDILQDDFNKHPIGSGPYKVAQSVEILQDSKTAVILSKNEYYYGLASDISYIRFLTYPNVEDLLAEISSVNAVVKVSGNDILEFENNDRFDLISYELPQYLAVYMNMDSEVLKDNRNVRVALSKSLDKDALIGDIDDKIRVDTPLLELEQDDWVYDIDFDAANEALDEAGYSYLDEDIDHANGRYDEDGNILELNLIAISYEPGSDKYNEINNVVGFLNDSWRSIGVSLVVEFFPPDIFNKKVVTRQYDLLLVGQNLGYNLDTYSYWHSTQANALGQNFSNYRSFYADSLIEGIRSSFDLEEREKKLKDLAKSLKDDVPAIFLYRPVYYYVIDGKISALSMDGVVFPSDRFSLVENWAFKY